MSIPDRIQRKRTKGWRAPAGTVCVSRPSRWGNPFRPYASTIIQPSDLGAAVTLSGQPTVAGWSLKIQCRGVEECLAWYRIYAANAIDLYERNGEDWLADLREAKYLACWCPLDWKCHGDVLIDLLRTKRRPE